MELKQAIPNIDEQIALLKKELEGFDSIGELTAEKIQEEIFKPKDEISQEIFKQQVKYEAFQSTLFGFKNQKDIGDIKEFLKGVREMSQKQFKAFYKKNKLVNIQQQ